MKITKFQSLILGAMGTACIMLGLDGEGYLANICTAYGGFIFGATLIASLSD